MEEQGFPTFGAFPSNPSPQKTSRPSVKLIIRNHSVPDLWICIPLKKETIFSAPLYPSCGVSSVLFHNTSYTLQCTSAHSTHHINTPLYPLLRAGIQLKTRCGDGEKAATGLLRLSPSLHTGLKLMNLIPGETQEVERSIKHSTFSARSGKNAAPNDCVAVGCRQDVECGFCFSCCWKLCQAQV